MKLVACLVMLYILYHSSIDFRCQMPWDVLPTCSQAQTELFCTLCCKSYTTSTGLREHMRTHTGQFRYVCSICGHGFIMKSHYDGHMNRHKNIRPNTCVYCGKGFYARPNALAHQKVCKKKTDYQLPWSCIPQYKVDVFCPGCVPWRKWNGNVQRFSLLPVYMYSRTYLERTPHWPQRYGLLIQVISGDRVSYIELWVLPNMGGLSRQVFSHGSGLKKGVTVSCILEPHS